MKSFRRIAKIYKTIVANYMEIASEYSKLATERPHSTAEFIPSLYFQVNKKDKILDKLRHEAMVKIAKET